MNLFFWRRKSRQAELPNAAPGAAGAVATLEREPAPGYAPATHVEIHDALLRFAVDCLVAGGARVRVEASDLVAATLADGRSVRYTTTLARARDDEKVELLVTGGAALAALVEECAGHAAVTSLTLPAGGDAVALARAALAAPACDTCGDSTLCEACPRREGRLVLRGVERAGEARIARTWQALGIELTYLIASSDRHGRHDEWLRVGVDPSEGLRLEPLAPEALAVAQAGTLPADAEVLLQAAIVQAEGHLEASLQAAAAFLRLRAEPEHQARLAELQSTYAQLRRESPDEAQGIERSLAAELERLADIYAVDVEARLQSACFVSSPVALVAFRMPFGEEVQVTVDLGRSTVRLPRCSGCEADVQVGGVCPHGHVTCAECRAALTDGATRGCARCAGVTRVAEARNIPDRSQTLEQGPVLTVPLLDVMTPRVWHDFSSWLLQQEGYEVERAEPHGGLTLWPCRALDAETQALAVTLRLPEGWALGEGDVQRVAAARAGHGHAACLLVTTASATPSAAAAAERLGMRLLDREALAVRLAALARREREARAEALRTATERAAAASTARGQMLATLDALATTLAGAANNRRAAGRAEVAAAARTARDAQQLAARAFLAWDTLLNDWSACFGERPERDASLRVVVDVAALTALGERAVHLGEATGHALRALSETPADGELGYGAWRRALLEELAARCESCRWRVLALDPERWASFEAAHDLHAQERAASAATSADHATARAAKAWAELAARARLDAGAS
jgi:hypothetical protein